MNHIISERPLALHGTSIEAVQYLFHKGVLPPSTQENLEGQFYFTPVSRNFNSSKYAASLRGRYTKSQAISAAKYYAESNSREIFLRKRFGFLPEWFYSAVDTKRNLTLWFEEDKKLNLSHQEASKLVDEMFALKGVIIEPSPALFEEFNYSAGDDPEVLRVFCRNGLPVECISAIQPLGSREHSLLERERKSARHPIFL